MNVNLDLNRILIAVVIAGIAALAWWLAGVLHASEGVSLWVFGSVLLALYVTVTGGPKSA